MQTLFYLPRIICVAALALIAMLLLAISWITHVLTACCGAGIMHCKHASVWIVTHNGTRSHG